jgi:aminomethyltransferase
VTSADSADTGTDTRTGTAGSPPGEAVRRLRDRQLERGGAAGEAGSRRGILRYGPVEEEHRRLRETVAVLDDADRFLLEIRGEEAREVFGGLMTHHVEGMAPGAGLYAFMLTARGRPVAAGRILSLEPDDGEEVLWADLPGACREGTLDHLSRYLPPRLAAYRERSDVLRLSLVGPEAGAVATDLVEEGDLPDEPLAHREVRLAGLPGSVRAVRREPAAGPGVDLHLEASSATGAWETLVEAAEAAGGGSAGLEATEIRRVELGLPAFGPEIHDGVLPQETGQGERAISFDKGCYTGQEVVARIHYRGKVNRHLRGLVFEEAEGPPPGGTELYRDGRSRGRVTTSVTSPRLGPVALGYVRREVEPGDRLALEPDGEAACRVEALPLDRPTTEG